MGVSGKSVWRMLNGGNRHVKNNKNGTCSCFESSSPLTGIMFVYL